MDFKNLLKEIKKFSHNDYLIIESKINKFIKTSQDKEQLIKNDLINLCASLFSMLKANKEYSHVAHWAAKGNSSYSDHLLFERIYNENTEEIDKFAEKMIPLVGESFINPIEISALVSEKLKSNSEYKEETSSEQLAYNLVNLEKIVLQEINNFREFFSKNNKLSLGIDDLISELFSNHESHIYLLEQRLKNN